MNNVVYSHRQAILSHLKKHYFLAIALGLILVAVLIMFCPFVSESIDETVVDSGVHTIETGFFSGFALIFGGSVPVYRSVSGEVVADAVHDLSSNGLLIVGFALLVLSVAFIVYVYLEEQHFSLAFLGCAFLATMAVLIFCLLPLNGFESKEVKEGETVIAVVHNTYSLSFFAIFSGILLLIASALIIIDYFLVYIPAIDDLTYVKYKQELVDNNILLSVRHLKVFFPMGGGRKLKAVHDVSFDIKKGECFGLVGESGCGKTTTGRSLIRLHHITSGSVYFKGYRIAAGSRWNEKEIKWTKIRTKNKIAELKNQMVMELENYDSVSAQGAEKVQEIKNKYLTQIQQLKDDLKKTIDTQKAKIRQIKYDDSHNNRKLLSKMQMIFQDPIDSLDPRMTVEDIIQEGLHIQGFRNRAENHKKACTVLEEVGLIADYCSRYANEFSGGQRQRIGIARAIVMNPDFMICDEPISALDVSIRAQIINLLNNLKEQHGLTLMFIAHDLSVVKYFCDRIAVMYFGEMVEMATSDELFAHPLHPYTRALLSAIPKPDPLSEKKRVRIIYNPKEAHDYSEEKPSFVEILPGHWVLANSPEIKKYKQMIRQADAKAAKEAEAKD